MIDERLRKFREKYLRELASEPDRTSVFVVSYPKSGRTWHRAMVGTYLATATGQDLRQTFELDALARAFGIGRLLYTHNGANFIDGLPADDPLVACADLWRGKRVLFVVRDIRDTLVSAWHHARYRSGSTEADISTFIRDPSTGVEKLLTAYNRWEAGKAQASAWMVLSYEAMHEDPHDALRRSLVFIGVASPDNATIDHAVQETGFPVMQSRERSGYYEAKIASTDSSDLRAMKMREGKVRNFAEYLSPDDLGFIAAMEARLGNPFHAPATESATT